ncbi:MAG: PEP/pyruvate-binding domain-containing protein [Christensenellales bacterium]|jgi:pyruvate,water dikinase
MAAFEKIRSGVPGLDGALDHIRLGDNVVWQVSSLDEYKFFAEPFIRQAIADGRNLNYIHFAGDEPLFQQTEGLKIHRLDASAGFESFTVCVHDIITREGPDAFYVFDPLSDLQSAWSTDLMMGNFFRVTCPYLFKLDTVAYFPVLRAHHSFETLARIRETTQLLLDVYSDDKARYLHPIKVWNRYSPEMFLPHRVEEDGTFSALTNGVDVSTFYSLLHEKSTFQGRQNLDSYERFFLSAKDSFLSGSFGRHTSRKIVRSMMTRDAKMSALILNHFEPEDYFFIKDRMIGTGTIGGKACGMVLARKLLRKYLPHYRGRLEPHDSFFIGTDVFYSYIVDNGYWSLRIEQQRENAYFSAGEKLRKHMLKGRFSEAIRGQFRRMLEYFGQSPIIVRSSSFLEDGFGNAFAGKYESIFCVNAGSPEERLEHFENAVRAVYASTMDKSALEYRRGRGLDQNEEQMAILVQRVSGTRFGDYFMPCAAGIGFSYSVYRWSDDLDPEAGMLRLVAGMGTRAVDRTGNDYPRLVNLDKPERTTLTSPEQRHSFSQRKLDVIEFSTNTFGGKSAYELLPKLPAWYRTLIAEHDLEAEERLSQRGEAREVLFVSYAGIVKNAAFITMMQDILKTLQTRYGVPIDIEYTVNFNRDGDFAVNLLQCRPLSIWKAAEAVELPELRPEDTLFKIRNTFMGNTAKKKIDSVIWVDSGAYYAYPYAKKRQVVQAIDQINTHYKGTDKTLLLAVPGRIGTSSPELGVPVRFSNISAFGVICEYSDGKTGYMPELSYGSHMFQDLVESDIFYAAIFENENTLLFNKDFWKEKKSLLPDICPELEALFEMVKVYETDGLMLYADIKSRTALCGNVK